MANSDLFIRKLSNLILYSSLWIAVCAAALVTFTYDVTGSGIDLDAYVGFVFCGTLVIYTSHRLLGIERVKQFQDMGRFVVISEYRSHILAYGIIGAVGGLFFLFKLTDVIIYWLALPAILSFLYVVPLGKWKRWRDYALVKIFLISGVWAALTGLIPFVQTGQAYISSGALLFFERALFIFAITIPFDIRDVHVDDTSGLKTLPQVIGIKKSKVLALGILAVSGLLTFLLISMNVYDKHLMIPMSACLITTAFLIWSSQTEMDDHYYTGLLDGTMFLVAFVYWGWTVL